MKLDNIICLNSIDIIKINYYFFKHVLKFFRILLITTYLYLIISKNIFVSKINIKYSYSYIFIETRLILISTRGIIKSYRGELPSIFRPYKHNPGRNAIAPDTANLFNNYYSILYDCVTVIRHSTRAT